MVVKAAGMLQLYHLAGFYYRFLSPHLIAGNNDREPSYVHKREMNASINSLLES
jgi:hypothetical protein